MSQKLPPLRAEPFLPVSWTAEFQFLETAADHGSMAQSLMGPNQGTKCDDAAMTVNCRSSPAANMPAVLGVSVITAP